MERKPLLTGVAIVVLDRGFVYVGNVECDADWCVIRNAHNIRVWGTTKGLEQLAQEGPTDKTLLDIVSTVRAPMRAVVALIESEPKLWKLP